LSADPRKIFRGSNWPLAASGYGQERFPGFVLMVVDPLLNGLCGMDWADYLRDQATMYRQLAEQTDDPAVQNEMLELASVCEEVANNMEDHLTGG
jgi:hypothetical protein